LIKLFFNSSARAPNLFAVAETYSIEAVCCTVEEFIPEIELEVEFIRLIILSIFSFVASTAFFDSSASFLTSSATTANPRP